MSTSVSEVVVQTQPVVHDVEALVQAAVSVLTNDMQIATHDQSQVTHDGEQGTVQLLMDTCNSNNIQERLYMCTDCNLAFYGEQGEQEWQWHLKQHKPFKCDLCAEAYEDKESLRTHVRTHSISMPFICDKCGSAYSLKNNLIQHMKTHEDKLFQCAECNVIFKTQAYLEKHLKLHSGGTINVFQCETCNKTFSQQKNLVQHMKIHQGNVGKQYKCPECPAAYSYKCHLTRHLIIHTGEKPYKCKFCGKAFNRNAHLIRHRKMHSGGEKEWKCQTCGFAFWEKGDLMRHMKSHEGNRPLKCDYCDQTFVWKRYLYKHLNNHHKAEDKNFCKTCLLCLPTEEELNEHEATAHSNRKPLTHTCQLCKQEFHFKFKLDEHMYEHTGEKAHGCQKCPQRFVSRKELDRHMMEHLQEVSFRCNTCEKTFSSVNELQSHVKLHTGNAKFPCMLCNSSFRWRSQLSSHMIIHSNDHDYKCGFCTRKFKRKRDLTRHVKIYHDTKPPYTCTECNVDFHSPFNLMQHKTETHWKDNEIGQRFSCNHCTGVFGIHSDLQKHLTKVHPPRPNVCLLCSKKFTLLKFLEKHFELKHEGTDMEIGKNYEIRPAETPIVIEMDSIMNEHNIDNVDNIDNNEDALNHADNENHENTEVQEITEGENNEYDGMEANIGSENNMITMEQIGSQLVDGALSSESVIVAMNELNSVNAPISEAITLAQFSQQASGEDIIPVFLQENYHKTSQPASIPRVVFQKAGIDTSQQSGTIMSSSYDNVAQTSQPQVITTCTIQRPQVVKIRQDGLASSVRKQPNQVKIPIIGRSSLQGPHIIVQQGSDNNKSIKILSMSAQQLCSNQVQNPAGTVQPMNSVPVVSLHEQGQGNSQCIETSLEQMTTQNTSQMN